MSRSRTKFHKQAYFVGAFGLCVGLLMVGWLLWGYFHSPTVRLDDGRVVRDLSVAEVGPFAAPRFEPLRRSYLANLEFYNTLSMRPVGESVEAAASGIRDAALLAVQGDADDQKVLARMPEGAIDSLALQIGLLLKRAAGMSLEEYRDHLESGMRLVVPPNLVFDDFPDLAVRGAPDPNADPKKVQEVFEHLYRKADRYESGGKMLAGWSTDPEGFDIGFEELSTNHKRSNILYERWKGSRQWELFRGHLSQAALMFHQPPEAWPDLRSQYDRLVRCEVVTVVEDRGGDRYPLWMELYFDPHRERWWPTGVFRMVSVRAGVAPALAY